MKKGRVNISFLLLEKQVGNQDVIGLAEFWVDPRRKGIGREALVMIKALAFPKIVVGFADDDVVGFYKACDWFVGKKHGKKWLVAGEPVVEFSGEIW